jgi:hypothetical protein
MQIILKSFHELKIKIDREKQIFIFYLYFLENKNATN